MSDIHISGKDTARVGEKRIFEVKINASSPYSDVDVNWLCDAGSFEQNGKTGTVWVAPTSLPEPNSRVDVNISAVVTLHYQTPDGTTTEDLEDTLCLMLNNYS